MANDRVIVHGERGCKGKSQTLAPGVYDTSALDDDDFISSVTIPKGWTVTLYEDAKFSGRSKTLTATGDVGDDFDNITSSLTVSSPDKEAIVKTGDGHKDGKGAAITIEQNDADIDAKSLLKLTKNFPPKFEQIMVLSFTMTIDQPEI
ncbi:hypothetical protein [Kitasatospora purpeofusca]|uniref:Uncharacterized protein n=1 Tax=Kitasatospora purpeofusca TaxID=67352 RepID=A0ABZ1TYG1_9ACTN|nr:hypothetical protein [Kitasatospora purpeofusca]